MEKNVPMGIKGILQRYNLSPSTSASVVFSPLTDTTFSLTRNPAVVSAVHTIPTLMSKKLLTSLFSSFIMKMETVIMKRLRRR